MLPHTGLFLLGKVALQMRIRQPLKKVSEKAVSDDLFSFVGGSAAPPPLAQKLFSKTARRRRVRRRIRVGCRCRYGRRRQASRAKIAR
ncbi:hypothetical protein E2R49_24465, partial [Salmonella enterica subsp. enterica serovar Minnesota]|nr:hypothetical protein [Salmonella enterica subsp. enterica serovar Minnesota]